MRLLCYCLLTLWLSATALSGQDSTGIVTQSGLSADELVKDIFADGVCETITNIRAIGDNRGIGYFEGGSSSIGLERGIILATGRIENSAGPNEATDRHDDFEYVSNDPDLRQLADTAVYDAVGLEFDFVPLDSTVAFRYVFASEEYCEFVGSLYNDVFGFFVSGPGIEGEFRFDGTNAAVVPGTGDFVSINTINYQNNSQYYVGNELGPNLAQCQLDERESPFLSLIEYDGFTTVLTAVLKLQPCQTYKLRMLVADVNDGLYDSAVFLEAGSFNIGQKISLSTEGVAGSSDRIYEGCTDGRVFFSRPEGRSDFPMTINYRVGASSTAEAGSDYEPLSGSVTIPAGQETASVLVETIADAVPEGLETLWLVLDIPCACYSDSIRLVITEPPELEVTAEDVVRCPMNSVTLSALIDGGVEPFRYRWSNGQTTASIEIEDDAISSASIFVTDGCDQSDSTEVTIGFAQPPQASLTSDSFAICRGDTAFVPINLAGSPPFRLNYRVNGGAEQSLLFDTAHTRWPITSVGSYQLIGIEDAACSGEANGTATVNQSIPIVTATTQGTSCNDSADGWIRLTVENGIAPYEYAWEHTTNSSDSVSSLAEGTYRLTLTDAIGCIQTDSFRITSPPVLGPLQVDCSTLRRGLPVFTGQGGQAPYQYSIDGRTYGGAEVFDNLFPGRNYSIFIRDALGCVRAEPDFYYPVGGPQMATLPSSVNIKVGRSGFLRPSLEVPPEQIARYSWRPSELFDCVGCPETGVNAMVTQNVELVLTDVFGCTDTLYTLVTVDNRLQLFVPNVFSPNGDGKNDRLAIFADPAQVIAIENLRVFNRWGTLLYESDSYPTNGSDRFGWDGTYQGEPAPTDVYIYTMSITLQNGQRELIRGDVMLVR